MKISIINTDSTVVIDGVGFDSLDLSTISSDTHAIQFDTATSVGHIEYNDGTANEAITSITAYQSIIDAWQVVKDARQAAKDAQPVPVEPTAQEVVNNESLQYLASTDWYITRHAETAVAVPADVTTARAAARAAIV
jgi:hypothetical protein